MAGSPDFPAVTMKDSRESRLKANRLRYVSESPLFVTMKDSRESRLKEKKYWCEVCLEECYNEGF